MANGAMDNLANAGRPLNLEEDIHVPQELRMAYRVLKNAGIAPKELELRKDIVSLRDMLDALDDDRERMRTIRELNFKLM